MTSPTKSFTCIYLIGLCLLGGCKPQESLPADQVMLRINESARVGDLTVRLDTLQESGCPRCFFAFNAVVSAVISDQTAQQRVKLVLYAQNPRLDSTGVVLGGKAYKVVLRDVTPHPTLDITNTQSGGNKAVISVTKL